ncbi:MAG: hypothetical protein R3342_10675 [Lutibacter sp.]|uniref:hypothetical protein n=1 Tax=Lutibacter sp. TaxID=1925666 RepID=UPI00299E2422|nr:hypothetical protein [Lutibacter sp.]MDX1829997.1 hypothetical protein [Lutibacter sp.]
MIRYLKRNQLDTKLYDACIQKSDNARIYAYSWYLDCVADNWDALVLNNYEAIMPLPWRRKYLIKYIYPPTWTQQLGVFSKNRITQELMLDFINAIPKKFKKITIQFNSENQNNFLKLEERNNFILALNHSNEALIDRFNNNRKRDLTKAKATSLKIEKGIDINTFLDFYLSEDKNYTLTLNQISTLNNLLNSNNKSINIWGIRNKKQLVACLVWLKEEDRITYLLPIATSTAKNTGLPTLLVAELIREFSNSNMILDFEGSMIEGVADFYKSFGATKEIYYTLLKYNFL